MIFKTKKISPQFSRLGKKLSKARTRKGWTLEYCEEATHVKLRYLEALEKENFPILPAKVYVNGFLRQYLQVLGMEQNLHLRQFNRQYQKWQEEGGGRSLTVKPSESIGFALTPKIIISGAAAVATIFIFGYIWFQLKILTAPPTLTILSPEGRNVSVSLEQIEIKGRVDANALILINGQKVAQDLAGNFSQIVLLEEGINEVKVTAKNRFQKQSEEIIKILKQSEPVSVRI